MTANEDNLRILEFRTPAEPADELTVIERNTTMPRGRGQRLGADRRGVGRVSRQISTIRQELRDSRKISLRRTMNMFEVLPVDVLTL